MSAESENPARMRLHVAPQAENDLLEIWIYIAQEASDPAIASRVVDSITDKFVMLTKFPYMGKCRDSDLGGNRRNFPVNNYVIFYQVKSCQVQILRVLHGSRDVRSIGLR
jgi:toxin ParE1/3/4